MSSGHMRLRLSVHHRAMREPCMLAAGVRSGWCVRWCMWFTGRSFGCMQLIVCITIVEGWLLFYRSSGVFSEAFWPFTNRRRCLAGVGLVAGDVVGGGGGLAVVCAVVAE